MKKFPKLETAFLLTIIAIVMMAGEAWSCINDGGKLKVYKERSWELERIKKSLNTDLEEKALSYELNPKREVTKAVQLMYLGRPKEAVDTLLAIEKRDPGQYTTASNLGAAYELSGDLKNAYKWTAEGIRRDSNSHYGTEWMHLYILEYSMGTEKQRLSELPQVVEVPRDSNADGKLMDVLVGPQKVWQLEYKGKTYSSYDIVEAVMYQLNERLLFVKKDSPVVADLLILMAKAMHHKNPYSVKPPIQALHMAEKFDKSRSVEIQKLVKKFKSKPKPK